MTGTTSTSSRPRPAAAPRADPRLAARKVAVARAAGRRRLTLLLVVVGVVVLLVAALVLLHSPLFSARSVKVSGGAHEPRGEVLSVTGLGRHPPLVDLDVGAAERALERLPWVATATVERHWPAEVSVRITERRPAAVVAVGGGRSAVVDASGRVLETVAAPPAGLVALSGAGPPPAAGGSLRRADRPLLELASGLPASFAPKVASVALRASDGLVLRLAGGPLVVLGSTAELHQKLVSLLTVVDKVSLNGIVTIDLRVPADPVLTR